MTAQGWDRILTPYLDKPIHLIARKAAAQVAAKFPNSCAVLFYGSCFRTGEVEGQLLDFYVIVDGYQDACSSMVAAFLNWLIPPNVYYFEAEIDGVRARAKYAVLSRAHFSHLTSPNAFNPAIWARFAQPVALAHCRDRATRVAVVGALSSALQTLLQKTAPLAPKNASVRDLWCSGFALTYATEFRAERGGRPGELFDLAADFYEVVTPLAIKGCKRDAPTLLNRFAWSLRRVQGRALHILRLIKAAATFDGGIDYLAWKVERHSGVKMEIKPWYRKHPVVAGLVLLPRLKGRGAIR